MSSFGSVSGFDANASSFGSALGNNANVPLEDDLTLPPNVREWIRKVKHYKRNNIALQIDPVREFGVTKADIDLVNKRSKVLASAQQTAGSWGEHRNAPLKYREQQSWGGCASSGYSDSLSVPGLTFTGGSIDQCGIDSDSGLRGSYVSRTNDGTSTFMDTCQKRAFPAYRGGEVKATLNTSFYQAIPFRGLGAGMGPVDVSNHIHFGETSRTYSDKKLANLAIDRMEPLIRDDFQQPEHVVLPFPRGGYDTRNFDRYARQDGVKRI